MTCGLLQDHLDSGTQALLELPPSPVDKLWKNKIANMMVPVLFEMTQQDKAISNSLMLVSIKLHFQHENKDHAVKVKNLSHTYI